MSSSHEKAGIIGSPGHSPALQYEIQLAEAVSRSGHGVITPERIDLCFTILDDLTPRLGVYQQIMRMLKQELFKAVYSSEYTARGSKLVRRKTSAKPSLVPHFTVAKRCMEERDQQVSKLKQRIESLTEQLYTCEAELEKASSTVEAYKHDIRERDTRIQKLSGDIRSVIEDRDHLQQLVSRGQIVQDRLAQEAEYRMTALKSNITTLTSQNAFLMTYKHTHDTIQDVLMKSKKTSTTSTTLDQPFASLSSALTHQLTLAQTLRQQLLTIQNTLIDEYDNYLTNPSTQQHTTASRKCRDNFTCNMKELLTELELLDTHENSLHSRLQQVDQVARTHPHEAIVLTDHPATPLVVQEQLLSKYSTMIYVSCDDGVSFYPLKEGRECLSCGEKTVTCPHKSFQTDLLIQLPLNSTHIKISRPSLHTITRSTQHIMETKFRKDDTLVNSEHIMDVDDSVIWDHYAHTYGASCRRNISRHLNKESVLLLFQLYCCSELLLDEAPPTSTTTQALSPLKSLYQFLTRRYHMSAVGPLVVHDFLSSLLHYHGSHSGLHMLVHVLSGTIDISALRYLLLLTELVDLSSWRVNQEFTVWSNTIFDFLKEEEIEQFSMNFTSFCDNKVSCFSVIRYLCWGILKHKDPLVIKMEAHLNDQQTRSSGSMTESEFAEAMLSLCPTAPDHLQHCLFGQSLAQLKERGRENESVPTRRLAYVAAYISLSLSLSGCIKKLQSMEQYHSPSKHHHREGLIKLSTVKALQKCIA